MIVRKLRANETYKASAISAVAFEYGIDYLKEKQEQEAMTPEQVAEKEKITLPEDPLPSEYFKSESWAALSDDGQTVYGSVVVSPYTVRFDGHLCVMGGVGGVSTLPPYRRKGAIRECMRSALADMNKNGFDFSYLYPFSRAYYRKFGYENSYECREWEIDFKGLRDYGTRGTVKMLLPGDDFSVLTELYNKRFAEYNLSSLRREYDPGLKEKNLLEEKEYIFVWHNEAGEPRGFLIFHNDKGVMDCNLDFGRKGVFLALDAEAYMGMFDFARTFAPNYHAIRFGDNAEIHLNAILGENNCAKCKVYAPGMSRVVSVERVLEKCRCRGSGELKIRVEDPMGPWNTATWKLTFGEGNRVERTQEPADAEMSINAFTSLILGHVGFEDVSFLPGVKVLHEEAPFSSVFYRKRSAVLDLF